MEEKQGLLHCPFCGKEPVLQVDKRYPKWIESAVLPVDGYAVICTTRTCPIYHADNTWFLSKKDAIEAWNRREM